MILYCGPYSYVFLLWIFLLAYKQHPLNYIPICEQFRDGSLDYPGFFHFPTLGIWCYIRSMESEIVRL